MVYYLADQLSHALQLGLTRRAEVLVAAPKIVQALFAATGDLYTWKLARLAYGDTSAESWVAVGRLPKSKSALLTTAVVIYTSESLSLLYHDKNFVELYGISSLHHQSIPVVYISV